MKTTHSILLTALATPLLLAGCASTHQVVSGVKGIAHQAIHPERFIEEPESAPVQLAMQGGDDRIAVTIDHWIVPGGPGTWVRAAKWDEVIVTVRNTSASPIRINSVRLQDRFGKSIASGDDPVEIETRTERLIGEYEDLGFSVAIAAAPTVVLGAATLASTAAVGAGLATGTVATGAVAATAATGGVGLVGAGAVGAAGAPLIVPAAIVAAPVYYVWRKHKKGEDLGRIDAELKGRQLASDVPAQQAVRGSQFYPIVPEPRALAIDYVADGKSYVLEISLADLEGLHVATETQLVEAR